MQVLVINSGSSSVKFELFAMEPERPLLEGEVERIGEPEASMRVAVFSAQTASRHEVRVSAKNHAAAFSLVLDALREAEPPVSIDDVIVVGHRVVHGGTQFAGPTLIDDDVVEAIRELATLAPVHAKANVAGIEAARRWLPDVPHVAVFDTSFHRTMPAEAREYALPRLLARENRIRRYGFHGTSHAYVARRAAVFLGRPLAELNLITLHLGNGASATAIRGGESVDTSMGMTPLEGLVMGTRCGDVDPAIPMLVGEITGQSREDVNRLLNFESGLKGLCGESDMREVHRRVAEGDAHARLAVDMFCYRVKKYIGAYYAALGHVDAIVFTAGIGENDTEVRAQTCSGLERLGIEIDEALNSAPASGDGERRISSPGSEVQVLVIPTDEELELARAALECVHEAQHTER